MKENCYHCLSRQYCPGKINHISKKGIQLCVNLNWKRLLGCSSILKEHRKGLNASLTLAIHKNGHTDDGSLCVVPASPQEVAAPKAGPWPLGSLFQISRPVVITAPPRLGGPPCPQPGRSRSRGQDGLGVEIPARVLTPWS